MFHCHRCNDSIHHCDCDQDEAKHHPGVVAAPKFRKTLNEYEQAREAYEGLPLHVRRDHARQMGWPEPGK